MNIEISKLGRTHGLKGHLKIICQEKIFLTIWPKTFIIKNDQTLYMKTCRIHNQKKHEFIVLFENIDTYEQAQEMGGSGLYIKQEDLYNTLEETDFFVADIVGKNILSPDLSILGVITGFCSEGNETLLEIEHKNKKLLMPATEDFIDEICEEGVVINHSVYGFFKES